ncbi:hypothetical protein EAI_08956 [Harpegnathos saltator]|uniref:Uncharacterized protein n=1 Tax=Harpegnathos saltator TaxID=610380 RepID=E2BWE2_HARSA|nr:hypothetical protein EAI_08956 [Harpegnathos saltator]
MAPTPTNVTELAIDGEINQLRSQINNADEQIPVAPVYRDYDIQREQILLDIITQMWQQMCHMNEQIHALAESHYNNLISHGPMNVTYGRTAVQRCTKPPLAYF